MKKHTTVTVKQKVMPPKDINCKKLLSVPESSQWLRPTESPGLTGQWCLVPWGRVLRMGEVPLGISFAGLWPGMEGPSTGWWVAVGKKYHCPSLLPPPELQTVSHWSDLTGPRRQGCPAEVICKGQLWGAPAGCVAGGRGGWEVESGSCVGGQKRTAAGWFVI